MWQVVRSVLERERKIPAVVNLLGLVGHRIGGRFYAKMFGWQGCIPLGSRISGSRRIAIGPGVFARGPIWIEAVSEYEGETFDSNIVIGRNLRCSDRVHITAISSIVIGDDCLFGSGVLISDNAHGVYDGQRAGLDIHPALRPLFSKGGVTIGARCWLGDNVVVLGGVEIGEGSVIAANSVVTRSIAPYSLAAGAPARLLRSLGSVDRPDSSPRGVVA